MKKEQSREGLTVSATSTPLNPSLSLDLSLNRSFPDERSLGPRLRLQRLRLLPRRNGCNDFPPKSAADIRSVTG
jgi:hypothetical protein